MSLGLLYMGQCLNTLKLPSLAAVAACLVASSVALADIGEGPYIDTFEARPVLTQSSPPGRASVTRRIRFDQDSSLHADFAGVLPGASLDQPPAASPQPQTVHQLPAGPCSTTLLLLGAGCLGAAKLGRSARNLHLQSLPDWHHTGGPGQIGHAFTLDLESAPLALCALAAPLGGKSICHHPQRELPSRREDRCFPTVQPPRGPPRLYS